MSLPLFLHGLGSVGLFSSRAFLPAFVTAVLLRFGPQVPWLAHAGLITQVRDVPTWFTSDAALVVLGLLAMLELTAERFPESRILLEQVHDYLKTGMAVLTYLGVLKSTEQAAVRQMIRQAGVGDYLPILLVGAGVFLACTVRHAVLGPLKELDEDDDLGLQRLFRWIEDLWGGLGPVALIVFPLLTLVAFGMAVLLLLLIERRVESRRERANLPCVQCERLIHPSALACPYCHAPVKEPREVGLLGQAKSQPADLRWLPYRLVAVKRCPECASRLSRRAVHQTCEACGHQLMDDPAFAKEYLAFIDRRVPPTCAVCFLLGLIPVLGVIPAVVYYRLTIVAPFRRYIPAGRGLVIRWVVRLLILVLVAFQWVPVVGALTVPAMALISYGAYRRAYTSLALAP